MNRNIQTTQWWMFVAFAIFSLLAVAPTAYSQKSARATVQKQTQRAAPTKEIVEKVLKGIWDKSGANYPSVKVVLTLNEVKFGKAYVATVQEVQVEGFPKGGMVTPAIVDFTVRTYYNSETQAVRRVRESRVYKNKFDEWAVMTGSVRGEDATTMEPPARAAKVPARDKQTTNAR